MILDFFASLRKDDYQRNNFDSFLRKIKFKYDIPSIHIGGSNGKGTTLECLYKCLYKTNKYKVGKFTSPYSVSPLESIVINEKCISEQEYIDIINEYKKLINKFNLSSFEVEVLAALTHFKNNNVDIALIECGMGGEDDATNVFTPILSIITSISLEHTAYLGSSLGEIALNKAGIIKNDIPLLINEDIPEEAMVALVNKCKETNSKIFLADNYLYESLNDNGYTFLVKPYENLFVPTLALFVLKDVALALSALKIIKDKFDVDEESVRAGVKECILKGRMNVVNNNPTIIIDGAHNPEGIFALKESLEKYTNKTIHTVFASFKDKNISLMLSYLNFISSDITLTTFPHNRARNEEEYFLFLDEYKFDNDPLKVIKEKMEQYPDGIILVTGSLAFAYYIYDNFKNVK